MAENRPLSVEKMRIFKNERPNSQITFEKLMTCNNLVKSRCPKVIWTQIKRVYPILRLKKSKVQKCRFWGTRHIRDNTEQQQSELFQFRKKKINDRTRKFP